MKNGNDKFGYYLPIRIGLGLLVAVCFDNIGTGTCLGVVGILSIFPAKKILLAEDFFIIRL